MATKKTAAKKTASKTHKPKSPLELEWAITALHLEFKEWCLAEAKKEVETLKRFQALEMHLARLEDKLG